MTDLVARRRHGHAPRNEAHHFEEAGARGGAIGSLGKIRVRRDSVSRPTSPDNASTTMPRRGPRAPAVARIAPAYCEPMPGNRPGNATSPYNFRPRRASLAAGAAGRPSRRALDAGRCIDSTPQAEMRHGILGLVGAQSAQGPSIVKDSRDSPSVGELVAGLPGRSWPRSPLGQSPRPPDGFATSCSPGPSSPRGLRRSSTMSPRHARSCAPTWRGTASFKAAGWARARGDWALSGHPFLGRPQYASRAEKADTSPLGHRTGIGFGDVKPLNAWTGIGLGDVKPWIRTASTSWSGSGPLARLEDAVRRLAEVREILELPLLFLCLEHHGHLVRSIATAIESGEAKGPLRCKFNSCSAIRDLDLADRQVIKRSPPCCNLADLFRREQNER